MFRKYTMRNHLKASSNLRGSCGARSKADAREVPVVLQERSAECGLACLLMVLASNGTDASIEALRKRGIVGPNGTSALSLIRVAKSYGLRSVGVSAPLGNIGRLPLPAILHWRFNHYVVLVKCRKRRYEIIDPSFGRMWVDLKTLDAYFTGVALLFKRWRSR